MHVHTAACGWILLAISVAPAALMLLVRWWYTR